MQDFIERNKTKIKGVLSCFDRMIFRGYLPLQHGAAMAAFLNQPHVQYDKLKDFLTQTAETLKAHAKRLADEASRPYEHLRKKIRMERKAREIAARDRIQQGLVCVFTTVEPCRSFSFRFTRNNPFVATARRQCLHVYYYFIDPKFGLIHIKIQTWFPMTIQVYVNGQEWLARKLTEEGIGFTMLDNVFVDIEEPVRAQHLADRLQSLDWPAILDCYARRVNPLLDNLLRNQNYYWVTAQSEYATDVRFTSRKALEALYPRLLSHGMLCFGAKEVMSFLGRKLVGQFRGEIITDVLDLTHLRLPGARIKHRAKENWIKMYDKGGIVLRIETVINSPEEFRVRRKVWRRRQQKTEWVPLRKGVGNLFRYLEVSLRANSRYLDALAVVSDPGAKVTELDRITRPRTTATGRRATALNPLALGEIELFKAVMSGEHTIRGFTNADIRAQLQGSRHFRGIRGNRRQSAKVTRILRRLHLHGLIAKIPRSRKWRVSRLGRRVMATALQVRELNFPQLLALSA